MIDSATRSSLTHPDASPEVFRRRWSRREQGQWRRPCSCAAKRGVVCLPPVDNSGCLKRAKGFSRASQLLERSYSHFDITLVAVNRYSKGRGTRENLIFHAIYRHLKTTRLLIQVQQGHVRHIQDLNIVKLAAFERSILTSYHTVEFLM
jgi:hypothetical protein